MNLTLQDIEMITQKIPKSSFKTVDLTLLAVQDCPDPKLNALILGAFEDSKIQTLIASALNWIDACQLSAMLANNTSITNLDLTFSDPQLKGRVSDTGFLSFQKIAILGNGLSKNTSLKILSAGRTLLMVLYFGSLQDKF